MMNTQQRVIKRVFDMTFATVGIILLMPVMAVCWVLAAIGTRNNGFFLHERIGKNGASFPLIKFRTMKPVEGFTHTNVTTGHDPRITRIGKFLRRSKLDELPQLFNVLLGHMSFVGPRPDVRGFADKLEGEDRMILELRPGITGPASLHFRNEEEILSQQPDPETYNRDVLWPEKVTINKEYVRTYSLGRDIELILSTITGK